MNRKTLTLTAFAPLLALALACGGGGGSTSNSNDPVTVATPVVTAPGYLATGGVAVTASTQTQSGCTFAWTLSGDATAKIVTGQGTNTITVSANGAAGISLQVGVTVQAETGGSSATGSATITEAVPPAAPQVDPTSLAIVNAGGVTPGGQFAVNASADGGSVTYAWTVTGGTLNSGQGTTSAEVTAGTPSAYPGTLDLACMVTDTITGLTATGSQTLYIYNPSAEPPATPVITGPSTAKGGATGLVYSVPAQSGCTYLWDVYNGQDQLPGLLTSGSTTNSVTITAPAFGVAPALGQTPNTYYLYCTVYGPGGQSYSDETLTVTQ
jgi:hypothetical protein